MDEAEHAGARDFFPEKDASEHSDDRGRGDHHPVRVARAGGLHRHGLYPLVEEDALEADEEQYNRLLFRRQPQAFFKEAAGGEHRDAEEEAQQQDQRGLRLRERVFCRGEAAAPDRDGDEDDYIIIKARSRRTRVV